MKKKLKKIFKRKTIFYILGIIVLLIIIIGSWNLYKPLPEGMSLEGKIYQIDENSIEFLYDLTYLDESGKRISEQEIFDRVFEMIDQAQEFILIDMFLWGSSENSYRNLSDELTQHLLNKKQETPSITINLITDEFNTIYGAYNQPQLTKLQNAGINVIYTDMKKMRDSNILYSSVWRTFFSWMGVASECNSIFLKFSDKEICARSGLKFLNFKANHRKLIVADSENKMLSLITSANPHDGSSAHSNVAVYIEEKIWEDIYYSEKSIANFSGEFKEFSFGNIYETKSSDISVQFLTEGKIKKNLIQEIGKTFEGDSIEIMVFYISDRDIVESLILASKRGVEIKLILDPNKDAFGMEKDGVPNRPVANELIKKSSGKIQVKWYNTNGEQFHTKLAVIRKKTGETIIITGSANFTKRNINDLNIEANVKVVAKKDSIFIQEIYNYFDKIWNNLEGINYTLEYESYGDDSFLKNLRYRFQEASGASTF
jgi:phosphatidylserine/phosphatidylglycerophosphate/cardiolipin synthase-like enzyme